MKYSNLTGSKFGLWTVIGETNLRSKSHNRMLVCRCSCGTEKPVDFRTLINGQSKGCVKCRNAPTPYGNCIPLVVYNGFKRGAERRGLAFNISREFCYDLFIRQNRKCALTGLDIDFPENGSFKRRGNYTASLDRINSDLDYDIDNVQWIHKIVNVMKNAFPQNDFVSMCCRIADLSRGGQ